MSIKINIPSYMKPLSTNIKTVEVTGETVGDCLSYLIKKFPSTKNQLFGRSGDLFEHILISINGESAYPDQLLKTVKDGDELDIMVIIGGG
jgi:molybdopterin converting factor small subunit